MRTQACSNTHDAHTCVQQCAQCTHMRVAIRTIRKMRTHACSNTHDAYNDCSSTEYAFLFPFLWRQQIILSIQAPERWICSQEKPNNGHTAQFEIAQTTKIKLAHQTRTFLYMIHTNIPKGVTAENYHRNILWIIIYRNNNQYQNNNGIQYVVSGMNKSTTV